MAGVALLATLSFLFLKKPTKVTKALMPRNDSSEKISWKTDVIENPTTFKEDVQAVLTLLVSSRMRPLLP